jgi:hypothetical protein
VLIELLFSRLERAHPAKYEAMGRPSLFLRNNIAGAAATLKFLIAREHRTLQGQIFVQVVRWHAYLLCSLSFAVLRLILRRRRANNIGCGLTA